MKLARALLVVAIAAAAPGAVAARGTGRLIQAKLRVAQDIYSEPRGSSAPTGARLDVGQVVLSLGESYGGAWVKIVDLDRNQGWVPLSRVDLTEMEPAYRSDFRHVLDQLSRVTSRWIWEAPLLAYASGPLGLGVGGLFWLNTARNGLIDYRDDQLEIGTGFYLWKGQATSTSAARFVWEIPVHAQWLFRFLDRGALMVGPRIGFSVLNDPTFRFARALPFRGGLHVRYYFDDDIGISFGAMTHARSVTYWSGEVGFNVRF